MASRRFFAYDPYDYYYTTPYNYPYPYPYYHQQQPAASARSTSGFFPVAADAEPALARMAAVNPAPRARSVSIPVHFVGSDPEPERNMAGLHAEQVARMAAVPRKRAPSVEEAPVRVQAAARGFMARRSVRAVREVEREAEEVRKKVEREAEALRGDARARIAVRKALMRLLLCLDAVCGAREYRRRVTRRVLALQDAIDALEPKAVPEPVLAAAAVAEKNEADPVVVEMAEENVAAQGQPNVAVDHAADNEARAAADAADKTEVDGDRADSELEAEEEMKWASDGTGLDTVKTEGSAADSEREWEMVTEEHAAPAAAVAPRQEPESRSTAITGAADGVDARKVMEMVAVLCEWTAQQCAVIGALVERVDALERAVRRVEDAGRRRRRGKEAPEGGQREQPHQVLCRLRIKHRHSCTG